MSIQDSSNLLQLNSGTGVTLIAQETPGWTLRLQRDLTASVTIEPLRLLMPDGAIARGEWDAVTLSDAAIAATGSARHATGGVHFELRLAFDAGAEQPLVLDWRARCAGEFTDALVFPWTLPDVPRDPGLLDLPSIHYGGVTYGTGMFPHPDPRTGFAFRADRLAQPALHYSAPSATWSFFAPSETPAPVVAEQLYSVGAAPTDTEHGLNVWFRYPQQEYGHRGDGGPDAYVAKETFAAGEQLFHEFAPGTTLEARFFVLCRPAEAAHDHAAIMRFLWRRYAGPRAARPEQTLLTQAGQHVRWFNRRLYNPGLGGGQYESPEGSNTAILGFVEQSLLMASTTLRYITLCAPAASLPADELRRYRDQAAAALTRWATAGRSPEGLLYTTCDHNGYAFGYRKYGEIGDLQIEHDESLDTIRLATEGRSLLAAAAIAEFDPYTNPDEPRLWVEAALSVSAWLAAHRLPLGGYAGRYHRGGAAIDPYPSGTAAVIGLFCDVSRWLREHDAAGSQQYRELAVQAYDETLSDLIAAGAFNGGTLDASCPDREAAIAALDACITLYDLTGDERYLIAARGAADNILSYTFAYPITTFGPETEASRRQISTFGATIVSPENQHLDPVATAPALLLYGIYTGDEVALEAAIETLHWTLDGRWATPEADGLKQSEQMLHTRWYYNTFFSQRGDVRIGMPRFGRTDSEHGWPQVVPTAAFLGSGQIVLDWRSGRGVGVDGWQVTRSHKPSDSQVVLELAPTDSLDDRASRAMLLKVLRLPQSTLQIELNGERSTVSATQLEHGYVLHAPQSRAITISLSQLEAT